MPLESLQNGRYVPVRQLGRGSMGEVYLVDDTVIGRKVAIKLMLADQPGYPDTEAVKDAVRLFKREAQAIASLEHPNILPLYDFGEEKRDQAIFTYMVMPHCQEGSLTNWLEQHYPESPLLPEKVVYFIEQAASALQYAHEHGVIHRDVKPSNFLLRTHIQGQDLPDLLLADFGIARMSTGTTVNTTHFGPRGTPRYMPPEQWESKPVPASDQYALAIMAYQLLTQSFPFTGEQMHQVMYQHCFTVPEPPGKHNPQLPAALDAVILRALKKKPEERFPTVQAFASAFREALQPSAQWAYLAQKIDDASTSPAFDTSGPTLPMPEKAVQAPIKPNPGPLPTTSYATSAPTSISSAPSGHPTPPPMVLPAYLLSNPEARTIADQAAPPTPFPMVSQATAESARTLMAPRYAPQYSHPPAPAGKERPLSGARHAFPLSDPPVPARPVHLQPAVQYVPPTPISSANPYMAPAENASPPVQPGKRRKAAFGGKIALWLSMILIVVLGGTGLVYYMINTNASRGDHHVVHNTTPTPDPNRNTYTSTMPTLSYYDPLKQAGRWQANPNDANTNGYCIFQEDGAYHVGSNIAQTYTLCPIGSNQPVVSDLTFEIRVHVLHGDCAGVSFRGDYQKDAGSFYYFSICSDGRHYLATYTHFGMIQFLPTQNNRFPALQANPQTTFTLAIVARGSSLTFYLNHQQVDSVTDSTYTSGQINLFCYEVGNPTEIAFSDARLWVA